jgi:2-polyprenyl-3-methyl-5-hydroxy-6-metoxy-1,4-benzoquinol methylase
MGEGSTGKLRSEEDGGCDFRYRSQGCAWGTMPDRIVPALTDLLRSEAVVLDAGCGNGRNAVWLADRGISVHAVDVSAEALSGGRERWPTAERVRFERADLRTLELADRTRYWRAVCCTGCTTRTRSLR